MTILKDATIHIRSLQNPKNFLHVVTEVALCRIQETNCPSGINLVWCKAGDYNTPGLMNLTQIIIHLVWLNVNWWWMYDYVYVIVYNSYDTSSLLSMNLTQSKIMIILGRRRLQIFCLHLVLFSFILFVHGFGYSTNKANVGPDNA